MSLKIAAVVTRFLKGMIAGAVSAMGMVTYNAPSVWSDFKTILNALALAATFGALTGFLLALQKWASWKDVQ